MEMTNREQEDFANFDSRVGSMVLYHKISGTALWPKTKFLFSLASSSA